MSDLKPTANKVEIGGQEYGMRFTLNAIDDIQEHFDRPITDLGEIMKDERNSIKSLRYLLTVLINEDIDCQNDENGTKTPHVEERYIGRHIDSTNMSGIISSIFKAFSNGTPKADEDPNVVSE